MISELISQGHRPVLLSLAGESLLEFLLPGQNRYDETINRIKNVAENLKVSLADAAAMHGYEIGVLADYVVE